MPSDRLDTIYNAIIDGDADTATVEAQAALKEGIPASEILYNACVPAMEEVGSLFERGEKFVAEMLIASRAMNAVVEILKPHLVDGDVNIIGTVVIGTVAGDLHDIGKNLVGMMLEGAGFKIIDLGANVDPAKFVDAVRQNQPDIVGMSALLTTTMPAIRTTIQTLKEAGLREQVKILIGGAPVTQEFADTVGADAFAPDAGSAARIAKSLVGVA
ncbi:MAG: cobalamin-binding protein [Chloroflexi bacterium]|nr:MAG: cobalamin-binding protein [Chloroflexota bacterium]